jgi:methylmalonyl-CoA mutase N-terminal domain/subunit
VRVSMQALSAGLGGTQSLHTNGFDEALALPTEASATLALRTQQILAEEIGVTATADPLGGSYFVEHLTSELEERATALMQEIDAIGGAVAAIEQRFMQSAIEESAYRDQLAIQSGARTIVGVNTHVAGNDEVPPLHSLDEQVQQRQIDAVQFVREQRDAQVVAAALASVRAAARGSANLLYPMREALAARATIGEVCAVLREEWGEYRGV